jgi:putative endonuclease
LESNRGLGRTGIIFAGREGVCPPFDVPGKTPSRNTTESGRLAESVAAAYLELSGYRVLERNSRDGPRELDLISVKDGWLIVVEVRYRGRSDRGLPEETLRNRKRTHLWRAGRSYWLQKGRAHGALRFDLITLLAEPDGLRLRHHPHFLLPHHVHP